jgi:hypothetical protein
MFNMMERKKNKRKLLKVINEFGLNLIQIYLLIFVIFFPFSLIPSNQIHHKRDKSRYNFEWRTHPVSIYYLIIIIYILIRLVHTSMSLYFSKYYQINKSRINDLHTRFWPISRILIMFNYVKVYVYRIYISLYHVYHNLMKSKFRICLELKQKYRP